MVSNRLLMFLEQNNTFYNYQFGFIDNHSSNHSLIEITEQIRNACVKKLFTCEVYLHLQKVFDIVKCGILFTKPKHYGSRGTSSKCLQSFICERLQFLMESARLCPWTSFVYPIHE